MRMPNYSHPFNKSQSFHKKGQFPTFEPDDEPGVNASKFTARVMYRGSRKYQQIYKTVVSKINLKDCLSSK